MEKSTLEELRDFDVNFDDASTPKLYVTLEELKQHLNVDFNTDDTYITGLIEPVQLAIESYLNNPLETYVKDDKIDRRIWHAIRILVANYYANREEITFATPQVIPGHITLLLQSLKRYT